MFLSDDRLPVAPLSGAPGTSNAEPTPWLRNCFTEVMTINTAISLIDACSARMNTHYQKVVFDERAIICFSGGKTYLLSYAGPRKDGFECNFLKDAGSLRAELILGNHDSGDTLLAYDGVGTGFESFIVLGDGMYLIWNNTVLSLDGIAKNPRWALARIPFIEMLERFRADPVIFGR
jgi:hypothetical protein